LERWSANCLSDLRPRAGSNHRVRRVSVRSQPGLIVNGFHIHEGCRIAISTYHCTCHLNRASRAAFGGPIPRQESELPGSNPDGVKQSVRYDLGNQPLGHEHATINHSWGLGYACCPCARADGRSLGHNRRGRETMPSSDRQSVSSPPNWKSCVRQRQGNGARPACLFQQMRCERRKSR
jgi:hypothetical protein